MCMPVLTAACRPVIRVDSQPGSASGGRHCGTGRPRAMDAVSSRANGANLSTTQGVNLARARLQDKSAGPAREAQGSPKACDNLPWLGGTHVAYTNLSSGRPAHV